MDYGRGVNSGINPEDVLFKDKFSKFIVNMRQGKIDLSNNNLKAATFQPGIWSVVSDAA